MTSNYPEAAIVSEWSSPPAAIGAGFHMDFLLHFGSAAYSSLFRKPYSTNTGTDKYGFSFFDRSGHGNIMEFLDEYLPQYQETRTKGLICLITGNHDITPRLAINRDGDDLELCYLFLLTMPGAPFIYYGDEIGMRTIAGLGSKEGGISRTGSRTPMQWEPGPKAGFSSASPEQFYLPVDPAADRPDVASQHVRPAQPAPACAPVDRPAPGPSGPLCQRFVRAGVCRGRANFHLFICGNRETKNCWWRSIQPICPVR